MQTTLFLHLFFACLASAQLHRRNEGGNDGKPETVQRTAVVYPTGVLETGIPATSTLPGSHGPGSGHGQGPVPGSPTGVTPGSPSGEPVAILPPAPEPQPYPGAPEQTRPAGSPPQTGSGAPYPSLPTTTGQHTGIPEAPIPTTTTGGPPPTYTSGASDKIGPSGHEAIIGLFISAIFTLMG